MPGGLTRPSLLDKALRRNVGGRLASKAPEHAGLARWWLVAGSIGDKGAAVTPVPAEFGLLPRRWLL